MDSGWEGHSTHDIPYWAPWGCIDTSTNLLCCSARPNRRYHHLLHPEFSLRQLETSTCLFDHAQNSFRVCNLQHFLELETCFFLVWTTQQHLTTSEKWKWVDKWVSVTQVWKLFQSPENEFIVPWDNSSLQCCLNYNNPLSNYLQFLNCRRVYMLHASYLHFWYIWVLIAVTSCIYFILDSRRRVTQAQRMQKKSSGQICPNQ